MRKKITDARRRAIRFFAENEGAKLRPVGIARSTLEKCVCEGLLRMEAPPFGFRRYFTTEAGRQALSEPHGDVVNAPRRSV